VLAAFHADHQRRYGYSHPQREVEIVTVRLRARIPAEPLRWQAPRGDRQLPGGETAPVVFTGKAARTAIVARESLPIGKRRRGPAIVTEYSATTVVPPGVDYELDRAGNLILHLRR
jgi:N-methylhydantoinase A